MEKDVEVYVSKVIEDENGEIAMLFQPELLKKMNFQPDTLWQWKLNDDGTITLAQVGTA